MRFFVGTSPKDAYMLPDGTHMMVNASQFWRGDKWLVSRPSNAGLLFLDSGGFVFFNRFGEYPFTPAAYLNLVEKLRPDFFASMDYPCEPSITGKLGKMPIRERIQRTVENTAVLCDMACMLSGKSTIVPVIQGWGVDDYLYCLELHQQAGTLRPYMAVGSMCTRSNSSEICEVFTAVYQAAIQLGVNRLHAFGLKQSAKLHPIYKMIYSRDSAVLYFSHRLQKKWERGRNGRVTKFAPNRDAKYEAIEQFVADLYGNAFRWNQVQEHLAIYCCLLDDDEVDHGLVLYYEEDTGYD